MGIQHLFFSNSINSRFRESINERITIFLCISDTVGSIVKMAFDRGLKKGDGGVQHVSQVVELMRDNIQSTTKSFENFLIEEFLPIRRPTKKFYWQEPFLWRGSAGCIRYFLLVMTS